VSALELGLGFAPERPASEYGALAARAEALGFDVISVFGDLMFAPPLPALLDVARSTRRVRMGAACMNPYTLHPVEIAGQVAALDGASGGRAFLGLTSGAWLSSIGIESRRPLAAVSEAAEIVARLLRGDRSGFEGEVFRVAPGLGLRYPVARAEVPLLIGAWGERIVALAGERAQELKLGGTANPAMVELARDRLRPGLERAGRAAGDVGIVAGAVTVVDEDGDAARALARRRTALYLTAVGALDPTVDVPEELLDRIRTRLADGDERGAGALVPDALLERFAIAGTPAQVVAKTEALAAAGVRRVEFGSPHGLSPDRGIELLGRSVVAHFRGGPAKETAKEAVGT
jgi:5,10-methylenetetrahydromethanopterin reductase